MTETAPTTPTIDYTEQLKSINKGIQDLTTYLKERDRLEQEAATAKATAEAEALQQQKVLDEQKQLEDAEQAAILAQEEKEKAEAESLALQAEEEAESQFRADMLQGINTLAQGVETLNAKTVTSENFESFSTHTAEQLESLGANTTVSEFENQVATAGYYADIGLILMVFGIVPAYLVYRFVKPITGLLSHIF